MAATVSPSSWVRWIWLALGLVLLNTGMWLSSSETQSHQLTVPLGSPEGLLQATLSLPDELTQPRPAVILVHGVIVNRQYMRYLADTLVQQKWWVLNLDLDGFGESYRGESSEATHLQDIFTALNFLQQEHLVDRHKIALIGHSMGGAAVLQAARERPEIRTAISLGMGQALPAYTPCRVLWGTGLYEALHPPMTMQNYLRQGTGQTAVQSGTTYTQGDCQQRWALSPTANHQTEVGDAFLQTEIVAWLHQQFGEANVSVELAGPRQQRAQTCLGLGMISLWLGIWAFSAWKHRLAVVQCGLIASLVALGSFNWVPPLWAAEASWTVMVAGFLAQPTLRQRWRQGLPVLGMGWLAIEAVRLVQGWGNTLSNPVTWLYSPVYLLQNLTGLWHNLTVTALPWMFSSYSVSLQPRWNLWLLLMIEVLYPGMLIGGVLWATRHVHQRCQGPMHLPKFQRPSGLLVGALLSAIGLLGWILWSRYQAGYLSMGQLPALVAPLMWQFGFPLLVTWVGLRWWWPLPVSLENTSE